MSVDDAALAAVDAGSDLVEKVVYLPVGGLDVDYRVGKPGRADDLLDHPLGMFVFIRPRRGGYVNGLVDHPLELAELQRAVVERGRQAEAVLDERLFARAVAVVHAANLRQRHVRFVYEKQIVLREVVHQSVRRASRRAPGEMPRVVFNPRAVSRLAHHLEVVPRALV